MGICDVKKYSFLIIRLSACRSACLLARVRCGLQVYQLQTELQKAQAETDYQKRRSLKCASPAETQQLREELSALRRDIMMVEKFGPVRNLPSGLLLADKMG